jgi:iron(III) transport system permease protein
LVELTANTALLGAAASLLVVAVAVAALLAATDREGGTAARRLLRVAALGYAVPGSVIGVGILITVGAFDGAANRVASALTGSGTGGLVLGGTAMALLYAYLVRFFAVGFNPLEAGMAKIGPTLRDAARVLGCGPLAAARRINLPLLRPALLGAFLLVLVDVMKELPATLILRPFNFDTLAVEAFQLATTERLDGAALPSLVIVAVGLVPVVMLCRLLDRGRGAANA